MDRVSKEYVSRSDEIGRDLASSVDQRVLRWFGHVERMAEYRMARRVSIVDVRVVRVRGRPRIGEMYGVKVALRSRGMTVKAPQQCTNDRKEIGKP